MSEPVIDEQWLRRNPEVQNLIAKFLKASDDAIQPLKEYANAIPEICQQLQEWIDDLQVQENAVNGVNTGMAVVSVASTIALFTPFAVFGVIGLIGTGVGGAAAAVGDGIANNVKANRIKDVLESKKDLVERAEEKMKSLQHLIEKVAETGKIPITSAETICFGIANVAKAGAGARVALQGDKVARLFGLFRVWRAGQLAPGGVAAIRGLAGAGSKLLGGLGAVIGIWVAIDGWVYGNRTKNATIENKKSLENSRRGLLQFIDILEGKTK